MTVPSSPGPGPGPGLPYGVIMGIDPMSGVPVYRQLADLLRDQIASGEIPQRTPLPSARTLSQQHGIAVGTVMRAFDVLRGEGLIRTVPGRGMWVVPPGEQRPPAS
jgi:DNA-binding transcriptional regulator YhcF (GntR family)